MLHAINMRLSLNHIVHTIRHSEDRIRFVDDFALLLLERIYDQITIRKNVQEFLEKAEKIRRA